jgi:hypothetical protein
MNTWPTRRRWRPRSTQFSAGKRLSRKLEASRGGAAVEFLLDLDRHGLLRTDYREHVTRLRPAIDDPAQIETLSTEDCLYLLTYHVRTDRFVDGHLARALDRGDLSMILRRLAEVGQDGKMIGD